jgi:hypothetical protein
VPRKEAKRISGACFVRVGSLVEFGRLTCALERAPFPLFAFRNDGNVRLAAQVDLFMGTPIFYYVDAEKDGEFLAYRSTGEVEEVQLVESATNPTFIYGPIIRVKKLPKALEGKEEFEDKYMAVEVADVSSLVKVGAYKMLFEEPPLPLFAFKNRGEWVLGTFARIDDYEEASIFFYARFKEEPMAGFMKYSPAKMSETAFSKKTDEHGFAYIKVVKLAEKHPLVEF